MVKLMKKVLYKAMGNIVLNQTDLETLLSDAQGTMNTRPMHYITTDPEHNLIPITPAHLVLGRGINPLPNELYNHLKPASTEESWKTRRNFANRFWKEWRRSYLFSLRNLTQHYTKQRNIKVGDVVLLLNERDTSSTHWPMAIVDEVLPTRTGRKHAYSMWLRLPVAAKNITDKGIQLRQAGRIKRGLENCCLLEQTFEDKEHKEDKKITSYTTKNKANNKFHHSF